MSLVKLGTVLFEQKETIGTPDGDGLELIGVSNEFGLQLSRASRISDLSRYKLIEKGWFAYNPMRVNVGSIGYAFSDDHLGIVSPDYVVFSCSDAVLPEYLLYILKSDAGIEAINKNASGAVRKRLYFGNLAEIEIFLPTIEEQKREVQKFNKIKSLLEEIAKQKGDHSLIARFKQSILQEAIQGKLTEAWRREHPDVEPAGELLQRIKAEKARLIKEKKIKKEKALPPIAPEEVPFELPEGWVWCRLGNLCSKTGSGSTPRGGKSAYVPKGVKFIRSQNVYDEGLRLTDVAFIPSATHERMNGTEVQSEDLLLNITGGSIGRCSIVPKSFDIGNVNQHVAIVRTVFPQLGSFLHKVIRSPYFQNEIVNVQTGAGREGLPKNKMDKILIPLPPEMEQLAIAENIGFLLKKCQIMESEISQSEQNAQQLMQAILHEAFEPKPETIVE